MHPTWEIFLEEKLPFKKKPAIVIKEVQEKVDWMDYMNTEAMEAMLKLRGTCSSSLLNSQMILPHSSCLLMGTIAIRLKLGYLITWGGTL